MYCEVEYPDSFSASRTNASHWRFPHRLNSAPPANESFTFHASGNILRVDLTIMNLTTNDTADYGFTVGECSFECANISLHVDECLGVKPKPVTQQNISVTAPLSASSVTLVANFTGDTSGTYPIVFSKQSVIDLPFHDSNKYSYMRSKVYQNCFFSGVLVIHNLSVADTDNISGPLVSIQRNVLNTQPASNAHSSVFILYCRDGIPEDDIEDLLQVLEQCGIQLHVDLRAQDAHGELPDNWTRWMQAELESRKHVVVICSSQLQHAFAHANDSRMGYVEMCRGQFHAKSVLNCIQPSKTVLVFVNCSKDSEMIPLPQLRDRQSFELNLTDLLEVAQDDCTLLENAIRYNGRFRDFRDLIQRLQY
ncbi:hypothetical protein GBAR_LOCUS20777 [Geodia barretti]|uniref:SEFIR domain-containing protein n=1 Tax=Geodia barretti TaxID=519541 RepID=A0AA35SYL4_GEOBA|nr:hypothetical protein GBAR_LOCUS20777 [Geodia barretti]